MITDRQLSIEEFEAFISHPENKGYLYELINGEVREKVITGLHSVLVGNIATLINMYVWQRELMGRTGVEGRFRPESATRDDRLPDVHYVSDPSKPITTKGAAPFMPDLVVEIKSPDDTYIEMSETATFYLRHGAKMVWLVYPEKRLVEVLTATERQLLSEDEQVSGGEVLPELTISVRDIFRSV